MDKKRLKISEPSPRNEPLDTRKLDNRAFGRGDAERALIARFHVLKERIARRAEAEHLWRVYDWLVVPFSLWPVDFVGLAEHMLNAIGSGRKLDASFSALLKMIDAPPCEAATETMAAFERQIETGQYENLVKSLEKFSEHEARVGADKTAADEWATIKACFDIGAYRNKSGIIRRRFSRERNFRDYLRFKWHTDEERFRQVFDAFCHRWNLYGMENDKPLIMKITVNPTPHGTMIFIPRCWSFDPHRDLEWREICRLHKAHGAARQGPKLSAARQEKQREKQAAFDLDAEAKSLGLRGDRREEFVLKGLGKDLRTDRSYLRRLMR